MNELVAAIESASRSAPLVMVLADRFVVLGTDTTGRVRTSSSRSLREALEGLHDQVTEKKNHAA